MKRNILTTAFVFAMSTVCLESFAQTEVNSLSEINNLAEGMEVKVNLNNIHTSAFTNDPWGYGATLYMQDDTQGMMFYGLEGITGGKTLNGYVDAETKRVNDTMCLWACDDTNLDNITQTDWDYSGTPLTTIDIINSGQMTNMLVTLHDLTSSSTGSDYSLSLSDGTNYIDLYNDWDLISLSKVPEHIKSITSLVVADAYTGEYYLIPISQDLIIDADSQEGVTSVKSLADLSDIAEGTTVQVNLNSVYTTATLGDAVFMEDANAGTIFYGINLPAGKCLNGTILAMAVKVGNDICLKADPEKTSLGSVTIEEGSKNPTAVYLNGARSVYWHNRLVTLTDVESEQAGDCWTLTQDEVQMTMKDVFGQLAEFNVPQYIKSLTAIVAYDANSESYVVAPTDKNLIIEGSAPVEPTGIVAVKLMEGGTNFELQLDGALVTSAEYYTKDGEEYATYIIEDETGGLLMQQFPQSYGWKPGDRVTGTVYGTVYTDLVGYGCDVSAISNEESYLSADFEITHGNLVPTTVTCAEALTSRYYNCYVKVANISTTTGTMTFMGQELEYPAVTDGTGTLFFDDGWDVIDDSWNNIYDICQLPDDVLSLCGHIEPYFGCTFIYPTSESDIITTGIKTPSVIDASNNDIYNLSGQRLSHPQKGINIINGRKMIQR